MNRTLDADRDWPCADDRDHHVWIVTLTQTRSGIILSLDCGECYLAINALNPFASRDPKTLS